MKIQNLINLGRDNFITKRLKRVGSSFRAYFPLVSLTNGLRNVPDNKKLNALRRSDIAFSCINKIAETMNDAPLVVQKKNRDNEWETIPSHPIYPVLRRPNMLDIGADLRYKLIMSEYSVGYSYTHLIRDRPTATPTALRALNPLSVRPIIDYSGFIDYYEYTNLIGKMHEIAPSDIVMRRRPDLVDEFYGLAPLQIVLNAIDAEDLLTNYVNSIFNGSGIPSGLLKFKKSLNPKQAEEKQSLWQKYFGKDGIKKNEVAVLDADADYEVLGSKLNELEANDKRMINEVKICQVFGVNPILVGALVGIVNINQRASYRDAMRDFAVHKISPELKNLGEFNTLCFLPEFESENAIYANRIRLFYDTSQMSALREDETERQSRDRENFKVGAITLNEFRASIGAKRDPKGDYYLQPNNSQPIDDKERAKLSQTSRVVQFGSNPNKTDKDDDDDADGDKKLLEALNYFRKTFSKPGDEKNELSFIIPAKEKKLLDSKVYDFEGVRLARKPNEVEKLIDYKEIIKNQTDQSKRLLEVSKRFRDFLIDQAVQKASNLTEKTISNLQLRATPKLNQTALIKFAESYEIGRMQIIHEINAQVKEKGLDFLETKEFANDDSRKRIRSFSDLFSSKLVGEIQKRAIDVFSALKLLGDDVTDFFKEMRQRLKDESLQFLERLAKDFTNASIQIGRKDEIDKQQTEISKVQYSAILDLNTCSPCRRADKMEGDTTDDVPTTPNPECEGASKCRCMLLFIFYTEDE